MFGIILCLFGGLVLFLLLGTFSPKKKGKKKKKEKSDRIDSLTWDDETEDLFEDDEFHFTPALFLNKKANAQIIWADPLPVPAKAAAKPNAPARTVEKPGHLYTFCFGVGLYLCCFVASYILLLLFSTLFLEASENVNLVKIVLIFSLLFSAVFVGWVSIPVSKKKNVWAFKAVNAVAAVLFSVLLILFFAICRSF